MKVQQKCLVSQMMKKVSLICYGIIICFFFINLQTHKSVETQSGFTNTRIYHNNTVINMSE
jgi:hypothetical protein